MADSKNIIWSAQINLCLQEIKVPEALLSATLKQMAEKMAIVSTTSGRYLLSLIGSMPLVVSCRNIYQD